MKIKRLFSSAYYKESIPVSLPRNEQLFYHANFLLPYSGAGTGIIRALDEGVEMNFVNDEQIHEFIITIPRKVEVEPANEPAKGESNQVKEPSRHKRNQVEGLTQL